MTPASAGTFTAGAWDGCRSRPHPHHARRRMAGGHDALILQEVDARGRAAGTTSRCGGLPSGVSVQGARPHAPRPTANGFSVSSFISIPNRCRDAVRLSICRSRPAALSWWMRRKAGIKFVGNASVTVAALRMAQMQPWPALSHGLIPAPDDLVI
jgi:hypothetical protein